MDIIDELKNLKIELLQDEWDKRLIYAWKHTAHFIIGIELAKFCTLNNIERDFAINNIKRTPLPYIHSNLTVSRFIAGYMPKLNEALFNKNNSEPSILKFMKSIKPLNVAVDKKKVSAERKAVKTAIRDAQNQKTFSVLRIEHSHSKHNWRYVK